MVQIRTRSLKPSQQFGGFFMFVILTKEESKKLSKVMVRILTMNMKHQRKLGVFFYWKIILFLIL